MKKIYEQPSLSVEEIVVEGGIATSMALYENNGIFDADYEDYGDF